MTLEHIAQSTKIDFPKPLNTDEVEQLLLYIARELPAHVTYNMQISKSIYESQDPAALPVTAKISGRIIKNTTPRAHESFETITDVVDCSYLRGLQFECKPGWTLNHYGWKYRNYGTAYAGWCRPTLSARHPYKQTDIL